MFRYLVLATVAAALTFGTACSSKKKNPDGDGTTASGNVDPNVEGKALATSPQGSDSGTIQGLSTINFDLDKANLTSTARQLLEENANWIKSNTNYTVQIEGHCDERGSVEYNLALGERRAQAVKKYLVNLGVDSKRLTIISYGEEKPVVMGDSEAVFSRNRRANFVPLPN